MRKIFIALFCAFWSFSMQAQHKALLYDFDKLPQSQLLNPSTSLNNKFHVGVPLFSGIHFNTGVTGVTAADLFAVNSVSFQNKVSAVLNNISSNDYISSTNQIEIINAGFKLNKKNYISGGLYTEIDVFANFPKDIITLVHDGNAASLNKPFLLSQLNVRAEAVNVLHLGVTHKLNEKIDVGARLKLYSGIVNINSTGNTGSFTTRRGANNIYDHHLNTIGFEGNSSGVFLEEGEELDIASKILFENTGFGVDLGFTYKVDKQTTLSASLLDVGYITYSSDVKNLTVTGDYVFSGIEFQFDGTSNNYWKNLNDDLKEKVPSEENQNAYTVMRPIKFYGAYKYGWGKNRKEETCYDTSYEDYYNNGVGAQVFTVFRPTGPKIAVSGFYERKISKILNTKITYTIDDFSYTNIGLGASFKLGKFNLYTMVDNVFGLTDVTSTNTASLQLGMNFIF